MRVLALLAFLAAIIGSGGADTVLKREGSLGPGDATLPDGRFVDWHNLQLAAGARYLMAASGETQLEILLRFADNTVLAAGQESGAAAILVYTAGKAESVWVGVANGEEPVSGGYSLSVDRVSPARSMQTGQSATRTIGAESSGAQGQAADSILVSGAKGERVSVVVRSSDFRPVVRVQNRSGFTQALDPAGTDSYVFLEAGQAEIVVYPSDPSRRGRYDIEVRRQEQARTLKVGSPEQGNLSGGPAVYVLEGKRGDAVAITAESTDFDTTLAIVDRRGRRAQNDDHGEGTDSRLYYVFPEDSTVLVQVGACEEDASGSYRLSATRMRSETLTGVEDLARLSEGKPVRAYLGTEALQGRNRYLHRFSFEAAAGEVVRLELASKDFDGLLELSGPDEYLASDDDSGGGVNALLRAYCPTAGTYTVRVTSANEWETGFYELTMARQGKAKVLLQKEESLEARDQRDISGRYYDRYTVSVPPGTLHVELLSKDFDAMLYLWEPSGGEIHSDDDGGRGTDARLIVDAAAGGAWTVYATSNGTGETGSYTLLAITY